MKTTAENTYLGFELNKTIKASKGFYVEHLDAIYEILATAKANMTKPIVAHLVIDSPNDKALEQLSRILIRWYEEEQGSNAQAVKYFACLEVRPRNKQRHLHLMVVFNSLKDSRESLYILRRKLTKLSKSATCKIQQRKLEHRAPLTNSETGKIATNADGGIIRLGSTYYHRLISEFEDAFNRFSYLAKVMTKSTEQKRGLNYGHSRIRKNQNTPLPQ